MRAGVGRLYAGRRVPQVSHVTHVIQLILGRTPWENNHGFSISNNDNASILLISCDCVGFVSRRFSGQGDSRTTAAASRGFESKPWHVNSIIHVTAHPFDHVPRIDL